MSANSRLATVPAEQVTGLVLAGGRGSRMQGQDKGLLAWQGLPLAEHALLRLSSQVDNLLLGANRNLDRYGFLAARHAARVCSDLMGPDGSATPLFHGPMAGIHAALLACTTSWLAVVPCDAPLLPLDLVLRLGQAIATNPAASCAHARTDMGPQPAFCLLHRDLLPALESSVRAGHLALGRWLNEQRSISVAFDDPSAFINLNTEADWLRLPARL